MSLAMETVQILDGAGAPLGTPANPLVVSGGGGNANPGPDYAKDGTDAAGVAVPTGAAGIRGWLSALFASTGAKSDAPTASGADTSVIGALRAIRDRLLGTVAVTLPDNTPVTGAPFAITATGPKAGFQTTGANSIAIAIGLTGAFAFNVTISHNSTDGVDGDWGGNVFGTDTTAPATSAPGVAMSNGLRYRVFPVIAPWMRIEVTSFTTAGTVYITKRAAPYVPSANYVGGGVINPVLSSTGTNRSGTVGTTASPLMAANTARRGWKVKNDTASDIWINFDTTATAAAGGGNIKIPAGGYLASEPSFVETGAMSVIGAAAALAITAREH